MATIYVSSVDGNDADDGLSWANAKATIAAGLDVATDATNIVYVDSAHNESLGSSAFFDWDVATANAHTALIGVNRSTGAHETGAQVNGTANGAILRIGNDSRSQNLFVKNIAITMNTGANPNAIYFAASTSTSINLHFENCTFDTPGTVNTTTASTLEFGPSVSNPNYQPAHIVFRNCTFETVDSTTTGGALVRGAQLHFYGCTFAHAGTNKSPHLFFGGTSASLWRGIVLLQDCDLSNWNTTGGAYFNVTNFARGSVIAINTRFNATPSMVTGTWNSRSSEITIINSDSADTISAFEYRNRFGTLTESTSIYADDGGQINDAGYSWQIVTNANCTERTPFITPWLYRFSDATTEIDVGLRVVHDSATDLNDRNAWANFEYISSASFPQGTYVSNRNASPLDGTAVDWTNDAESWTGTGGFSNENTQTIQSTFTPAEQSVLRGRLQVGATSKTLYLDAALRVEGLGNNPALNLVEGGAVAIDAGAAAGSARIFGGTIIT